MNISKFLSVVFSFVVALVSIVVIYSVLLIPSWALVFCSLLVWLLTTLFMPDFVLKVINYFNEKEEVSFSWKGELHREDGLAVEYNNGNKEWYQNVKYHREDGPAIEYVNGNKFWYLNGKWHTNCEPARELCIDEDLTYHYETK